MSAMSSLEAQRERAAKNQSLFREVNERIEHLSGSWSPIDFICECTDETCDQSISLTLAEYEGVRAESNSFFVVPGHELLDIEEVTESNDRYRAVSKLGAGAAAAERLDPRKRAGR
jgi:hypothetical protein